MSEPHGECFQAIQKMLDSYEIPEMTSTEPPTILEIAGFPHWENVCSNILAFFLNTREGHGFDTLFIRSILEAHRSRCSNQGWLEGVPLPDDVGDTNAVEREVRTHDGKRIDILVDCAEVRICIENKIWSGLDNDLRHYREHCEKNGDERSFIGIVLSPNQIQSGKLDAEKFVSITYGDLFEKLDQKLDDYTESKCTRYRYLFEDFRKQALRFRRTLEMKEHQKAFLDFWKKNHSKIDKIESNIENMRELLRENGMAKAHVEKCLDSLGDQKIYIKGWVYQKDTAAFCLVNNYKIDGCRIFWDVEFHPLRINFFLGNYLSDQIPSKFVDEIRKRISSYKLVGPFNGHKQYKFAIKSPFEDDSVCDEAVKISLPVLKYIAECFDETYPVNKK